MIIAHNRIITFIMVGLFVLFLTGVCYQAYLPLKEGILCGTSSGAAMWAARIIAKRLGKGKKVVVIFPDGGERYLSTDLFTELKI